MQKEISYLRIFKAFIKFGKTHVLREFLKKDFDKDATAKLIIINSNNDYNGEKWLLHSKSCLLSIALV